MNNADMQALYGGLDSIVDMRARKRQIAREAEDQDIRRKVLKLQEEQAADTTAQRKAETERRVMEGLNLSQDRRETMARQQQTDAWARDPNNPLNQARMAQTAQAQAQTKALAAKPPTAISAQLQGIDEFTEGMTAALLENEQAMAAAQAGDPTAQARVMKAQLKLGNLQAYGAQLMKGVRPEKPTSIVKIKRQSEDGGTTEELEVPAELWNDQHPAWGRFNPTGAIQRGAPSEAASYVQTALGRNAAPASPAAGGSPAGAAAVALPPDIAAMVGVAGDRNAEEAARSQAERELAEIENFIRQGAILVPAQPGSPGGATRRKLTPEEGRALAARRARLQALLQ